MNAIIKAAFVRLHNACEPGPDQDDEDMMVRQGDVKVLLLGLVAVRSAERERCAKVCNDIAQQRADFPGPERGPQAWRASSEADGATACADAIRMLTDGEET